MAGMATTMDTAVIPISHLLHPTNQSIKEINVEKFKLDLVAFGWITAAVLVTIYNRLITR